MRAMPSAIRTVLVAGLVLLVPDIAPARAETAAQGPFRLQFREVDNTRGPVIEGFLYNGLAERITAGAEAFFVVPLSVHGASYRVVVESFDNVARERPGSNVGPSDTDALE
jgi:hypothetical protein